MRCCVGANISCHSWCGLVWLRPKYNVMENTIGGMYNGVSVVKLIVDVKYDNGTLHSMFYMWLWRCEIIILVWFPSVSCARSSIDPVRLPRPRIIWFWSSELLPPLCSFRLVCFRVRRCKNGRVRPCRGPLHNGRRSALN